MVELGAGLNTRFDRLDNGRCHWVDLDLPDSMELRRRFFAPTVRNQLIAGSVLETDWFDAVREHPGPYFFVCEAVLPYLEESAVRDALEAIGAAFPGARFAFDTAGRSMRNAEAALPAVRHLQARFVWATDEPRDLEAWVCACSSHAPPPTPPRAVRATLPVRLRLTLPMIRHSKRVKAYRMNLFELNS